MTYLEMLTRFKTILDRDDCTDAQARIFMSDGMIRVTRDLRIPSMERALLVTPTDYVMTQMPVPTDLIQIIDVLSPRVGTMTGQMTSLKRLSYRALMDLDNTQDPYAYSRFQQQIYFRGAIPIGTQIQFLYYGNFSDFTDDNDSNELSASFPDVAVYAALKYAGDYFEHPLTAGWENTYQQLKAAAIAMGMDLENEGGVFYVEPTYGDY